MPNITLSVSEDIHKEMKKHKEIRWSEIAREAISEHAMKLKIMDQLTAKSKLTEKDAEIIGNKIKRGIAKRHGIR